MPEVVIIHKSGTPAAAELAGGLADWLKARGNNSVLLESQTKRARVGKEILPALPPSASLVVVLGGDGTMLGAVRAVAGAGLWDAAILGVNLGGLGYLTALGPEELYPAMEMVLDGDFQAPPRMMAHAVLERKNGERLEFTALNDIVLNKASLASLIDISVTVDDHHLTTLRCDGLIVATPTGSTAYNLSAGGPICYPNLDCMVMTPICSFALSNRPLLLSPSMTLGISLAKSSAGTMLVCDGQVGVNIGMGDRVLVSRAPERVRIINSPFRDYFEILRTKLRWG